MHYVCVYNEKIDFFTANKFFFSPESDFSISATRTTSRNSRKMYTAINVLVRKLLHCTFCINLSAR